jgi:hypothetical protein
MSLISVLTVGPAVGVVPGTGVVVGAAVIVGKGVRVGSMASVARAAGEQAASPPSIPSAPTFKASLREIFCVMALPLKVNKEQRVVFLYQHHITAGLIANKFFG